MQLRVLNVLKRTILIICIASTGCLFAQSNPKSDSKSDAPVTVASLGQAVAAPTGKAHDNSFVIGVNDVLAISVWKEPDVSRSVPVRSDGKISLPLAGEVQAAGLTPLKLEQDIASKLKDYISEPEVTVIVQQINSQKFNILGMINRPGSYSLTNSSTVLDAIAVAGGFRDFAKQKSIYVLRQNPNGTESRLPFNYKEVIKGKNMAQNVKLQSNDTIVVP
ncbi:MAG TPA: polysaccharide biosynthesis/export family protein [Candidatus Sulfotelmatobacter sp.]|nr:polysaccharide biosynthesis/export family protein [Candidatus Sulfotelmatobacter sp.]